MAAFKEYTQYDALGLAQLIKEKQVNPKEVLAAAIAQIDALNPELNAIIHQMHDYAEKAIEHIDYNTPFAGVPFLFKDLGISFAGVPFQQGSRFLRDFIPKHDAELTQRFKKSGVITLGKTNTPEFGLNFHTEPVAFGPTRNPWNKALTVGGSSGGSAAAVASGMVPIAHASDGGGSIRVPAACCGLFGLKPSRGRTPFGPDVGKAWQGFAINHVLTRTVRDSAAMLDTIAGSDIGAPFIAPQQTSTFLHAVNQAPPSLKIGLITTPFMPASKPHPDCLDAVNRAAKLCETLGHTVEAIEPPTDPQILANHFAVIVGGETAALVEELSDIVGRKPKRHELELATRFFLRLGKHYSAKQFAKTTHVLDYVTRVIARLFTQYDLILTPALNTPPVAIGSEALNPLEKSLLMLASQFPLPGLCNIIVARMTQKVYQFSPFTPVFNISGSPAMSVPLYQNDAKLPIGVQFAADFGNESVLLSLASQLEQAKPWLDQYPFNT